MSNIVFKYINRQILAENPCSLVCAREDAKRLFNLDEQSDLNFYARLPSIGLVEISEGSWKNLKDGTLIIINAVPPRSSKGGSNTEEPHFYDARPSFSQSSTTPFQLTTQSSTTSISISKPTRPSSFSLPGDVAAVPTSTASSRSSSHATAIGSVDHEHLKGDLHTPLLDKQALTGKTEFALGVLESLESITVLLEYPNRRRSVTAVPVSMVLKVEQKFHVMLGNLSRIIPASVEHIELYLIRKSKATKISPIASPAQLEMMNNDCVRIRVRSPIVTTPTPAKSLSEDISSSSIWNESFKLNTFGRSQAKSSWGQRPTLPSSPSQTKVPSVVRRPSHLSTSSL